MKSIKISELKIGDVLIDEEDFGYGHYVNNVVSDIRLTKSGRYVILYDRTYLSTEGVESPRQYKMKYSNGALVGANLINLK